MGHIFISYSHADKEYVHKLHAALQNEGFDVWIDGRIDYGDQWAKVIQKHLDECDVFIIVMSGNSYESEMVQNEITRAREKKKPIFPVLLDGESWLIVQARQYVDVRDRSMPSEKFYRRLETVTSRRKAVISSSLPPNSSTPESKQDIAGETYEPVVQRPQSERKLNPRITAALIGLAAMLVVAAWFSLPMIKSWFFPPAQTTTPMTATVPFVFNDPHPDPSDEIDSSGIPMRLVPAGRFTMGSESGGEDESPSNDIDVSAFYIDKYEVTNASYEICVNEGKCQRPWNFGSYSRSSYYGNLEFKDYPVVYVDWNMAKTFCNWRGAELPTEAQWEKAARGTDERIYPWGNLFDGSRLNSCDKNCDYDASRDTTSDDGYKDTAPVGNYPGGEGPYGTYDMAGNVWEWVMDWYSSTYYQTLFDGYANPQGPENGPSNVIRGGSWINNSERVRSTERGYFEEGDFIYIGFRCVKDAP